MTREEAKRNKMSYAYLAIKLSPTDSKQLDNFIDRIYNDFESRTCKNCSWYLCEVCTNDESPLCTEFVSEDYSCVYYAK